MTRRVGADVRRDLTEGEARRSFEDMMRDSEVPEGDWEYYWSGFLGDYVEWLPYDHH